MDDTAWQQIERERRSLADLLARLTPAQWESPSLCAEWRVRDVAAHVAMTPAAEPRVGTLPRALLRTRGDLWGAGRDVAVAYAVRPTEQLVDALVATAGSRRTPVFVDDRNVLLDLVVHGQDIAVALGIERSVDPDTGAAALDRNWSMGWPFHARKRFAGVRLVADDGDWSRGDGPEVRGRLGDLLLVTTGRPAALERLAGDGVPVVRKRLRIPGRAAAAG